VGVSSEENPEDTNNKKNQESRPLPESTKKKKKKISPSGYKWNNQNHSKYGIKVKKTRRDEGGKENWSTRRRRLKNRV